MKLLVLGAGRQGRTIAANLAERPGVTDVVVADAQMPPDLPKHARYLALDAKDARAVRQAALGCAGAVSALPATIGTIALPALIEARVPTIDVSFTIEMPFHLDAAAKTAGVPLVCDLGVAPGLSHILAAALLDGMPDAEAIDILVGGLPLVPPACFRHAVYFNARDLLDEYLRPARMRLDGRDVAPAPLDAPVTRWHDADAGALEAFASDGLRSLLASCPHVPNMRELTLRAPGHLEAMRAMLRAGRLDPAAVDRTAADLAARYPGESNPDRLLMEVRARRGRDARAFRLHQRCDARGTAMSLTTAYTAAAGAWMLATGTFKEPGVHAPEKLGSLAGAFIADLAERGVRVERKTRLTPI